MPNQNVVIAHGLASAHRLKYQIVWTVRLYDWLWYKLESGGEIGRASEF